MDTLQQTFSGGVKRDEKAEKTALSDSLAEGFAGAIVVVLALMGLLKIMPGPVLALSVIVMGVAFLLEGGASSARVTRLLAKSGKDIEEEQPGVGVTAEFVAGASGIVLGILALLGLYPSILVSLAVITYGSALIFGSGLVARMNDLETEHSGAPACFTRILCDAMLSAAGIEFLAGVSAGILGIIALTGMDAPAISLTAMLITGLSGLLNGAAATLRVAGAHK